MADSSSASSELRKKRGDGIAEVKRDTSVSSLQLNMIGVARIGILWLVLGGGLAVLIMLSSSSARIQDLPTTCEIELEFRICDDTPVLVSTGLNSTGFLGFIADETTMAVTFNPKGDLALNTFSLPQLRYFASEEVYMGTEGRMMGLSFGLFTVNELIFDVHVDKSSTMSCVKSEVQSLQVDVKQPALAFYGQAVENALSNAGRRLPQATGGPLLIRTDTSKTWSSMAGTFGHTLEMSSMVETYWAIFNMLRICITVLLLFVVGRFAYTQWVKAVEIWVVQYDYLWEHDEATRKGYVTPSNDAEGTSSALLKTSAREPIKSSTKTHESVFEDAVQACSLLFVLDHVVGDAQTNSEGWVQGLGSALLHGAMSLLLCVMPVVHALFFPAWKGVSFGLTATYFVVTMVFGVMYYMGLPYNIARRCTLYIYLGLVSLVIVYGAYYLVTAVLFLLTRLIVHTAVALSYLILVASVVFYFVFSVKLEMTMKETLEKDMKSKSKNKGAVIKACQAMALDTKTILLTGVFGAVMTFLLAAMLLLVNKLYFDGSSSGTLVMSGFTPFTTLLAGYTQVKSKATTLEASLEEKLVGEDTEATTDAEATKAPETA